MSDQIDAKKAEERALDTLFKLTEETVQGPRTTYNIPPEVRLEAAKELLKYAKLPKSDSLWSDE